MPAVTRIAPFLWFDHQAEEAANFYVSIFKNSRIVSLSRYPKAGQDEHKMPEGSLMTVTFELDGHPFTALNGGPIFHFTEAISLEVSCDTQAEIDYYWNALSQGGDPKAQVCGWLKDRYGLSWQVVPSVMHELLADHRSAKANAAMTAMMKMKKLDIEALERAAAAA